MSDAAQIERDEEMLGELAELDLALAKAVYSRAIAAEDAQEMAALGRTYQRLARSLRQTIALRDRLKRMRRKEAQEAAAPQVRTLRSPPPRDPARTEARKDALRTAMERVIWAEAEGERADYLVSLLEERLEHHGRSPAFAIQPLDEQVADLCDSLGLPRGCGNDWRNLPDPDRAEAAADDAAAHAAPRPEPELRSSA